jgi:hypothetical protein
MLTFFVLYYYLYCKTTRTFLVHLSVNQKDTIVLAELFAFEEIINDFLCYTL